MNPRLKNLKRIEFPVTYLCNGRCIHCSVSDKRSPEHIDGDAAARAVKEIAGMYKIESVMTFGGEPLLFPDAVYKIHSAARDMGIKKRQVITNGCFPAPAEKIANELIACGCNDILVSADAFHQATLPIEKALDFAVILNKLQPGCVKVQPAWVLGEDGDDPYDKKTREIIEIFEKSGIKRNGGNIVFPEGNAKKYLSEYFSADKEYINPYEEDPDDLKTVSIEPDGGLLGGNIYKESAAEIFERYGGLSFGH